MSTETEQYFKKLTEDHLKRIAVESNKDSYTINQKEYRRRKITVKEFQRLEQLRGDFADAKERAKAVAALQSIYFEAAKMYLGMTEEEYYDSSWEEVKFVIDACNFRTLYGAPFLSSSSTSSSGSERAG